MTIVVNNIRNSLFSKSLTEANQMTLKDEKSALELKFLSSIEEIDPTEWARLVINDYPFLTYQYLAALESSQSIGKKSGWLAKHITVFLDEKLIFLMPCYEKYHSYGEYVFDFQWAEAYRRYGLNYYPKLVAAIPFTPVPGPRFVYDQQIVDKVLLEEIIDLVIDASDESGASGIHILFPSRKFENDSLKTRVGVQYYWFNHEYKSFDDFLGRCKIKQRKNIRRERRALVEQGIQIHRICGEAITAEILDSFYCCYQMTYLKRSGHGGYLTKSFFEKVLHELNDSAFLFVAKQDDNVVGSALYFQDAENLYGRYWGAVKDIEYLHFELCYYSGIEYAINNGLKKFDAGVQGEHKIIRGFEPTITYSQHHIKNEQFRSAIDVFLTEEEAYVRAISDELRERLPFKGDVSQN